VFRGKFVAARAALYAHEWVVYAKQPLGGPEQVLEYLGRYTHRVAISNERIVAVDGEGVAFRVRAAAPGTGKKRTLRLTGEGFIERFLWHVLPRGFKRIRHYGVLAPAHKAQRLAMARTALGMLPPDVVVIESVAAFMARVARLDWAACPRCHGGRFVVSAPLPPQRPAGALSRGPP
jgi:hypothetical protein